jgi:Flp pilus assembly protein TadG
MNTCKRPLNTQSLARRRLRRCGSATLELALTLVILLNVTYGAIEFGQYFYVKNQLQGAAREGARAGVTSGSVNSDVTGAVANVMSVAGMSGSGYTVTISPSNVASVAAGTAVQVTVSLTWGNVMLKYRPFSFIGTGKVVSGVAVMRHE